MDKHYHIDWTHNGEHKRNIASAATATLMIQYADAGTWVTITTKVKP